MAGSIEVRDLRVERGSFVLEVSRLSVRPREVFAILGSTGSGKTVLMESIAGAFPLDGGCILLDGKDVESLPVQQRHLGILYQDYALFPHMTVRENIAYGLRMNGCPPRERDERVQAMLSLFEIGHLAERYPGIISGGESQRTALARALVLEPEILLLDEPFRAMDALTKTVVHQFLLQVYDRSKTTVFFITHDLEEAIFLGSKVYIMTTRPATIKKILDVDIPRPRDFRVLSSPTYTRLKEECISAVHEEALKAFKAGEREM